MLILPCYHLRSEKLCQGLAQFLCKNEIFKAMLQGIMPYNLAQGFIRCIDFIVY